MDKEYVTVIDGNRRRLAEKSVSGSEGTVCFMGRRTAVKLYHDPDEVKIDKVKALISKVKGLRFRDRRYLERHMALPRGIIKDEDGNEIGFKMRRFSHRYDHHEVMFIDNSRTYVKRFVFASHLARLAQVLHKNGILIGDFNRRNFLANADGKLMMVDADTVDFTHEGVHYKCRAYYPETVKPETLQMLMEMGSDYAENDAMIFDEESDDYSLAYTVYKLIALGSPYACTPAEEPEHKRILDGICPIYKRDKDYGVPGYLVKKRHLGFRLNSLFKKVFVCGEHVTANKLYKALRARLKGFDYQIFPIKTYGGDRVY